MGSPWSTTNIVILSAATAACIYLEVHRSFGPEGPPDDKQKLKSRFLVALLASRNDNE